MKYKNRGLKSFCCKEYLGSEELIYLIKDFEITERTLLKSRFQQCMDTLEVRNQCWKSEIALDKKCQINHENN